MSWEAIESAPPRVMAVVSATITNRKRQAVHRQLRDALSRG